MNKAQQLKQDLMAEAQTAIKDSGMTHQQVADIIGVSRQRISSLVGDQSELFSIEYLMNFLEKPGKNLNL
jgi:predicted XRE-type DNA-binding protein